jgi:hypothetical protein
MSAHQQDAFRAHMSITSKLRKSLAIQEKKSSRLPLHFDLLQGYARFVAHPLESHPKTRQRSAFVSFFAFGYFMPDPYSYLQ